MNTPNHATRRNRRGVLGWSPSRTALLLVAASLVAVASLLISGCSSGAGSGGAGPDNSKALEGKGWQATEIAGATGLVAAKETEVTAQFAAGSLSGFGGVNRYTASCKTQAGDQITISPPAATQMAGPKKAMAQEHAYFLALTKATKYTVSADSLTLMDVNGDTVVRYAVAQPTALVGTKWEALAYDNGKGGLKPLARSSAITAIFGRNGSLTGNATINTYSTTYTISGDVMSIDAKVVATTIGGPAGLMRQEDAYLEALPKTAIYAIEGDELCARDLPGQMVLKRVSMYQIASASLRATSTRATLAPRWRPRRRLVASWCEA